MSKKSGSVILSITVVLTLFVAASVFLLSPARGSDSFASAVMDEARKRQNSSVVTVSGTLETDTSVRSDEERMAEKVSGILLEDQGFVEGIGEKNTAYIESAFDNLEKEYTSSVDGKITQMVDDAFASHSSELDDKIKTESQLLDGKISGVENSLKGRLDALDAKLGGVEERLSALESSVSELGSAVESLESADAENKAAIAELKKSYSSLEKEYDENRASILELRETYSALERESEERAQSVQTEASAPIPAFSPETDSLISEDDYKTQRDTLRSDEINRVMSYFGL